MAPVAADVIDTMESMNTPTDLAWAAGFFDGEGCIHIGKSIQRQYENYQLVISVTQAEREPLDKLQELFGGFIKSYQATRYTRKYHLHWGLSSIKATNALRAMLPYLTVKREQAELALKFQDIKNEPKPRDRATGRMLTFDKTRHREMYREMRALKVVVSAHDR
jgi:hypothetical protein